MKSGSAVGSDIISVYLNIDESVQGAKLVIYDLTRKILSSLNIKERNNDMQNLSKKTTLALVIISLH
ncbi:MAG: hypothetical protein PSV16_00920 [Flavobacterium sp.]|nr:hypothetical protein [Flavobacterium sp.]